MTVSAQSHLCLEPCLGLGSSFDDRIFAVDYLIVACQEGAHHTLPVSFDFGSIPIFITV